jgi:hypothetical protein
MTPVTISAGAIAAGAYDVDVVSPDDGSKAVPEEIPGVTYCTGRLLTLQRFS